ncbi:MAG: hypothetical protein WCG92_25435 [Hyphomicrobiales bacterium]|nr:hypothetical protein [Alphaproteobacteria bacterium]
MTAAEPASEKLREAIESLRGGIDRVEFWADALNCMAKPVPEYYGTNRLAQHLLPAVAQRKAIEQR